MNARSLTAKLVLLALAVPTVGSAQLFKWTDENGVVHYGDRIPPQYANQDRSVLNNQGIIVDQHKVETDAQRAERERLASEEEAKKKQAEEDGRLVASYTKVSE